MKTRCKLDEIQTKFRHKSEEIQTEMRINLGRNEKKIRQKLEKFQYKFRQQLDIFRGFQINFRQILDEIQIKILMKFRRSFDEIWNTF